MSVSMMVVASVCVADDWVVMAYTPPLPSIDSLGFPSWLRNFLRDGREEILIDVCAGGGGGGVLCVVY